MYSIAVSIYNKKIIFSLAMLRHITPYYAILRHIRL